MNSSLITLALFSGMRLSPALIQNIQDEKRDTLDKWKNALKWLLTIILGYVFYMRAPVDAVDSAGKTVYSSEGIQKSMEKMFQENAYASFIKDSVLSTLDTVFELLKPSKSEGLLLQALMSGMTAPQSTTNVIQQQPAPAVPWIGGQPQQGQTFAGLRTQRFVTPRAQGAVIMPDGTVITE